MASRPQPLKDASAAAVSPCLDCPRSLDCFLLPIRQQEEAEAAFAPPRRLRPGDVLFARGRSFDRLYAVREGLLARWHQAEGELPTVVGFYLPGDVAGLGGFAHGYYRYTVTAVQPALVCPVEWAVLEGLPGSAKPLQRALSWQGEVDGWQHRYLMRSSARERVEGCLAALRQRCERLAASATRYPLDADLLASHLGLDLEEVRRWAPLDARQQILL